MASDTLIVFDPRKGLNYDFKFGHKEILRSAEHSWIILSADVQLDRECTVIGPVLSSLIGRMMNAYCDDELLIQHGPPIYQHQKTLRFPSNWRLIVDRGESRVFHVPRAHISEFEGYFRFASSYEEWMFFFVPRTMLPSIQPFVPAQINLDLFQHPPVPWKELIWTEGDMGSVVCFLSFSQATDRLVDALIQEGAARPANRSLTFD
jgi:hypothetical protein